MQMTYDDWINNPMGRKNSVFSAREMYRNMYMGKLDKILLREGGKVDYVLYKSNDKYFIHMRIPSEVIEKFYYDVVIEFYTDDEGQRPRNTLKDYYVKFFSNDPSYVYTFAHAFLENDLFVRDLIPRMSKEAITKVASERNPKNEVGYVKSLFFTYLLIKKYNLFEKQFYDVYGKKYTKKGINLSVMHSDEKIALRKAKQDEVNKDKKKERQKSSKQLNDEHRRDIAQMNKNVQYREINKSNNMKVDNVKKAKIAKRSKKI